MATTHSLRLSSHLHFSTASRSRLGGGNPHAIPPPTLAPTELMEPGTALHLPRHQPPPMCPCLCGGAHREANSGERVGLERCVPFRSLCFQLLIIHGIMTGYPPLLLSASLALQQQEFPAVSSSPPVDYTSHNGPSSPSSLPCYMRPPSRTHLPCPTLPAPRRSHLPQTSSVRTDAYT